jgi:diacylglycerol kinase family enzyme
VDKRSVFVIFKRKRLAVIFNPMGGSARGGAIERLKAACAAKGLELVLYTTTAAPGSARDLARQAIADGCDLVIACGGDGTVCAVAEGLMGTDTPMAILPGGTGNLFARAFNTTPDAERLVELICMGQPQALDMMRLKYRGQDGSDREQLYLVAVGLGKVSDAISGASARMKRIFGKLTYVVRVLLASLSPNPVTYTVTTPGTQFTTKAVAVFALNAVPPSMATLSRACNASDGLVDTVTVKATGFFSLLAFSLRLVLGRPDLSPYYLRLRSQSVRIDTDRPVCPNIDGDPGVLTQSMEITSLPQAVKAIVS